MTTNVQLNAGDDVDSRCLKCKGVTNHTIIATIEDKIAKVQCNTCGGRHNYRPALPDKPKKKAGTVKRAAGKKMTISAKKAADKYSKLVDGRGEGDAIKYSMTATFSKADLVDHPTFGLGVVSEEIPPNKIEVNFEEGGVVKILVCNLAG